MDTAALVDLDSLPRKLLQELSIFADDIVKQFDRANQTKDQLARLSLDIDAAKQDLKESEERQAQLEEQLREKADETNLQSQNIEDLQIRLLTIKRDSKF